MSRGTWNRTPSRYRFQWFREHTAIPKATDQSYRLGVADVARRLKARVYVKRRGYDWGQVTDRADCSLGYRVPVFSVTYRIDTRGTISTSVGSSPSSRRPTLTPRGWRNAGVAFRRVNGPSDFSLVLAEASWLPRFSSVCSVQWSCRAGRYVVINQLRWKYASPSWHSAGMSLRDYRNLVVNHDKGQLGLGHGHLGCRVRAAGAGDDATVQLAGCRHNPWPLPSVPWSR